MGPLKMGPGVLPYRDINVHAAPDSYTFTSPSSPDAPVLAIDRPTGDLHINESAMLSGKRVSRVSSIAGILGIIHLRLDTYIIVITKAEPVGRLKGHMIYRVAATDFLPLRERQIRDPDEDAFLSLLRDFVRTSPLYFSYSLDLTNSFQRHAAQDATAPMWRRADDRFFWNRFVCSDLIDFRAKGARGHPGPQPGADPYILPVIFGIVAIRPTKFRTTPLTLALVSRRSRFRGGTRYFSRGIDPEGHVANYNETEQVLVVNDAAGGLATTTPGKEMQILSYVQTRGSVPVYWAEINTLHYVPKLQVRAVESAFPAARLHFEEQVRLYGDNYMVNLVNQKGRERRVKEAYERIVELLMSDPAARTLPDRPRTDEKFTIIGPTSDKSAMDRLHYVYFDFHNETKGLRLHRAQLLLDQLRDALDEQAYFRGVDMPGGGGGGGSGLDVRATQSSVVRTNCMDCLDRTNVVQSLMARQALDRMLRDLGLLGRDSSSSSAETFAAADPDFEHLFSNLWADNADAVSSAYSGTGAMKTDMTRTGKRTRQGALRDAKVAVTRYCRNNFLDGPRQDAFDLFLGAYRPDAAAGGAGGSGSGSGVQHLIFADTRPALIQAIPYLLGFSVLMVLLGSLSPRMPDAAVLPLRVFTLFWTVVAGWCFTFVWSNGMLYVNWPKLNPRPWATEGVQETMGKVRKDRLIGQFVVRHERGLSTTRYLNAEEGKKRIE